MKRFLLFLLLCTAVHLSAQTDSLPGKYKFSRKGRLFYLEIGADSTFTLIDGKDTIGGRKFIFGTGEATTRIKVDTTTSPMSMDVLFIEKKSGQVIHRLQGIYKADKDYIKLRMNRDASDRPKSFMPLGNLETLQFRRI